MYAIVIEVYPEPVEGLVVEAGDLTVEFAFCPTPLYDFEIAQGSNGVFNPGGTTTRAHAAKMFVNFLGVVE